MRPLARRLVEALSPAQSALYAAVKARWERSLAVEVPREREMWGEKSAADLEKDLRSRGIECFFGGYNPEDRRAPAATWNALERSGYIRTTREARTGSELRKGPWGRWLSGTRSYTYNSIHVVPLK